MEHPPPTAILIPQPSAEPVPYPTATFRTHACAAQIPFSNSPDGAPPALHHCRGCPCRLCSWGGNGTDATENAPCPSLPIFLSLTNATVPAGHHEIRSAPIPRPRPVSHGQESEVGGPEAEGGNCVFTETGERENMVILARCHERQRDMFIPSCLSFMLEFSLYQECHFLL